MSDQRIGSPSAQAAMIVFSDFECPYCGNFATQTWPEIQRLYVQTGKLQVSFHHLPLARIHHSAFDAAVAAECAGSQAKFWQMHDALFEDQKHLADEDLRRRAERLGLDMAHFQNCLSGDAAKMVQAQVDSAGMLGVSGTPTFFFGKVEEDGRVRIVQRFGGAANVEKFRTAVDLILKAIGTR